MNMQPGLKMHITSCCSDGQPEISPHVTSRTHTWQPSERKAKKKRWLDNITEDCEALCLPLPDADSLAHDRVRWRTMTYNRESGAARVR